MDEKKFAGTPAETDKGEAVRDEALSDEELDAVAGGEGKNAGMNIYHPGYQSSAGFLYTRTEWIECFYCHGPILAGEKHDCSAKKVPIR